MTWKSLVLIRVEQLRTELQIAQDLGYNAANALRIAGRIEQLVGEAKAAASTRGWRNLLAWLTGSEIERAWAALHEADELLYLLRDPATLRAMRPRLLAAIRSRLGPEDPRRAAYEEVLRPGPDDDRVMLRQIRKDLDQISDDAYGRLRNFRNVALAFTVILLIGVGIVAADGPRQPWLPITHGAPPWPTTWQVLFVGALGGLLAGVVALRALEGFAGPYGVPIVMAIMKIPAGALTGLLGALWMQNAVFSVLAPQGGLKILAYVALFGYAQQALTTFADRQAASLLAGAEGSP